MLLQGFTGELCESRMCQPGVSNPCMNGGSCVDEDGPSQFRCQCPPMFYGDRCEHNLPESSTPVTHSQDCVINSCQEKAGNGQCDVRVINKSLILIN